MLRLYRPIHHEIFKLQDILKHLVISVWCEADCNSCRSKLNEDLKALYDRYAWLKLKIDSIYDECNALLSIREKQLIQCAFRNNNNIEKLCNGSLRAVDLIHLPSIVEDSMKPLLIEFYENLLDKAKVPGTKKDYYEKLIKANGFLFCPACGITRFESESSKYREAYDHYLPKSEYPFVSVNFQNLVPLCYKCNSDRKKTKNPVAGNRKAFFPFSKRQHEIQITLEMDKTKDINKLVEDDLCIELTLEGRESELDTWDWLFDIKERYNSHIRDDIYTIYRQLKTKHRQNLELNNDTTIMKTIDNEINAFSEDKYTHTKFLHIAILQYFQKRPDLINIL